MSAYRLKLKMLAIYVFLQNSTISIRTFKLLKKNTTLLVIIITQSDLPVMLDMKSLFQHTKKREGQGYNPSADPSLQNKCNYFLRAAETSWMSVDLGKQMPDRDHASL